MSLSELRRYEGEDVWASLVNEAEGQLESELASLVAWRRACALRSEAEVVVEEMREELATLEPKVEKLRDRCAVALKAARKATEVYNAQMRRSGAPHGLVGSAVDKAQRVADQKAADLCRERDTVRRRVQVLKRELAVLEPVYRKLVAIAEPETSLLQEVGLV